MTKETQHFRSPGELIKALLTERHWTQTTLSAVLGLHQATVNRMIANKAAIDAKTALALEEVFGVPADRFLALQLELDLKQARIVTAPDPGRATRAQLFTGLPIAEMNKRGWIDVPDIRGAKMETELMRFFGVNRLEDIEILPHAAKKTTVNTEPTPEQIAWLYRVRQIAEEVTVPAYSPAKLDGAIQAFSSLRDEPDAIRYVPRFLTEAGVRFVVVEALQHSKIDGVCFWLDASSPVIGMSLRFDRIDNFWFVLRHECAHVRHGHGKSAAILDSELEQVPISVNDEETIANDEAADFCVATDKMESFYLRKQPYFAEIEVMAFAKRMKVHPGLVVGQLHRRTGRYDFLRKHLVQVRTFLASAMMMDGWGDIVPTETGVR